MHHPEIWFSKLFLNYLSFSLPPLRVSTNGAPPVGEILGFRLKITYPISHPLSYKPSGADPSALLTRVSGRLRDVISGFSVRLHGET